MSLSSLYLDAFVAIAQTESFSEAARKLHVTQSALSQRIQALEQELELTLLIRGKGGIRLTEAGARLLRYGQTRAMLEEELFNDLRPSHKGGLGGVIRLAGYSSVMRSVVIPCLTPLLAENPDVQCLFLSEPMIELPGLLRRSEVDFIVMDRQLKGPGIERWVLGQERYVVIESRKRQGPADVYLDNSPDDTATELFFRHQSGPPAPYRRSYLGETYALIDGVAAGLGRAVMPRHLVTHLRRVRIVRGYRPLNLDVTLHAQKQPFHSRLHQALIAVLTERAALFLKD